MGDFRAHEGGTMPGRADTGRSDLLELQAAASHDGAADPGGATRGISLTAVRRRARARRALRLAQRSNPRDAALATPPARMPGAGSGAGSGSGSEPSLGAELPSEPGRHRRAGGAVPPASTATIAATGPPPAGGATSEVTRARRL